MTSYVMRVMDWGSVVCSSDLAGVGLSSALATAVAVASSDAGILPQPFQVVHVPGAGGTIGSRQVKDAAPDGYTILAFNESLATANALGILIGRASCKERECQVV